MAGSGIAHGKMLTPKKLFAAKLMNLRLSNSPFAVGSLCIIIAKG
jgi:hypothetical protein